MTGWLPYNTEIVLRGVSVLGAAAGVIGCFAVLRRRALVGDALAHAALPGLGVAFLVTGRRDFVFLLAGAALSGLLGIAVLSALQRWTRLKQDAAIGLIIGTFSGAGVVLFSVIQQIPRGPAAGLNTFIFGSTAGLSADDVWYILWLGVATLMTVVLLYKELKLVSFDPEFAHTQGWPAQALDALLLVLLLLTVVVGLPAVGALLIAALLVIPAAAARFWTDRLALLLILSGLIGTASGVLGTLASDNLERVPAGPAIISACATLFVVSLFFAPRRGLVARWLARRRDRDVLLSRLREEEAL